MEKIKKSNRQEGKKIAKRRKQARGITLIALVVTIIVLIILATTSINAVFGENGIIKKAQQAKELYENSVAKEQADLDKLLEEYNSMFEENGSGSGGENPPEPEIPTGPNGKPLTNTVTTTEHETIIAEDEKGNQVVVPGGFKIAEDSGTTVQQGIVVEDSKRKSICMDTCK